MQLGAILRAQNESGQTWDDPSEDLLFMLIEDVERGDEAFLIVEDLADSTGQTYVQSIRMSDGTFDVERREGTPDRHYATNVADMRVAHAVVTSWAFDAAPKVESLVWSQLRFGDQ
ncbi:hypothetical protein CVV68_01400 [Arthrobacter livingstonensis]|uniref:Uncharacterized protein n=1 Tax=Arthrobacter livingstonensis TaxID=670078 RepID=A0A2V5LFD4_9MICC|nr:hypothetical protein CVV68_01400 [Arthrobacter livingstonensis]